MKKHNALEILFRNVHAMFFSIDVQTNRLLQLSPSCEVIYGHTVHDFQENPHLWLSVVLEEDRPIVDKYYPALLVGRSIQQSHRIRHADGTIKWVETKIMPTLNNKGKLVRIDGITSDVTLRKEAEKKLEQRLEELTEMNGLLREANQALDTYVYNVALICAPLASIQGCIDQAQGQDDGLKMKDIWKHIQEQVANIFSLLTASPLPN